MKPTFTIAGLLAFWTAAVAAAPQREGEGFIGSERTSDAINETAGVFTYVVLYEKNETMPIEDLIARLDDIDETVILRRYNNTQFYGAEIRVGKNSADAFQAMAEVAMVEKKVAVKTLLTQKTLTPWGLQSISNDAGTAGSARRDSFTYSFDDEQLGDGVDIYVVDTGVRESHAVFQEGGTSRVTAGFSFLQTGSVADGDGHGTHVAGTAGGLKFGVAQNANIIAVKVLGDDGAGDSSDTIAGMDWIINRHEQRKNDAGFKGSVMSMSWGLGGVADAVDSVVLAAAEAGIHISVAAGNDASDACVTTPARNGGVRSTVVSVGSVSIDNTVSSFSNIGACVDIFAPGSVILSSFGQGDDIVQFLSGTSMACPHVSGVMAYLIAQDPENLGQNPAALKAKLLATARKDTIKGNLGGSANLLLSNGVDGGAPADPPTATRFLGSPSRRARDLVANLFSIDKRWQLHSEETQLRF